MFTSSDCKDKWIRKFEFVAKTQVFDDQNAIEFNLNEPNTSRPGLVHPH